MNHIADTGNMVERMAQAMKAKRDEMIAKPLQACYRAMAQAAYEVCLEAPEKEGKPRPWYPDDNPNWREHTPGDPMPCEGDQRIAILTAGLRKKAIEPLTIVTERGVARRFVWREDWGDGTIVAWRPAEEGE